MRATLREALVERLRNPLKRASKETFWALKDVSFDVHRGDVIGIVGRNGAGKSTLLKILSRITQPTVGRIDMFGRVGSLLEVGTGFHPELTGRENIFLNGAILGMKRGEIRKQFDAIVDFAGVEQFLETPVKRYSSGMYVRLAFAVAAHLEPEILIVDEVLAVGDAEFQKKCLGKMADVATGGRTILFVSHNMGAVQMLCRTGVLLRRGHVASVGPVETVVGSYLSHLRETVSSAFTNENPERQGTGTVRIEEGRILNEVGSPGTVLTAGKPVTFEFRYRNPSGVRSANMYLTIFNHLGIACTQLEMLMNHQGTRNLAPEGVIRCRIPRLPLPMGEYRVAVGVDVDKEHADVIPNALVFDVDSSVFFQSTRTPASTECAALVEHEWEHDPGTGKWTPVEEAPVGIAAAEEAAAS
jgi:lipopolysaccharide transport system ATP-binding protein